MKHEHLPHIDIEGFYQFVTFRTHDSTDSYLKKLSLQNKANSEIQLDIDQYLDSSQKGAYLTGEALAYLRDFLISKDGILFELVAFSIMPNHVHLLFKPNEKLVVVMQKIKGASSRVINQMLSQKGKFWATDYYDKAIRDERHFSVVYKYIKHN
ncbi:MAG: transposase, partial [Gammaproteobacteria bacterium]|nr:transposase [Gammaproteobacteria bacterium]